MIRADALFGVPDIIVLAEGKDLAELDDVINHIVELDGIDPGIQGHSLGLTARKFPRAPAFIAGDRPCSGELRDSVCEIRRHRGCRGNAGVDGPIAQQPKGLRKSSWVPPGIRKPDRRDDLPCPGVALAAAGFSSGVIDGKGRGAAFKAAVRGFQQSRRFA